MGKSLSSDKKTADLIGYTVLIGFLIVNVFVIAKGAFNGFSFYDWGGFLDASWRVFRGQKPYTDFFYTTGPIHLYMLAFFYGLFGFSKAAVLMHMVTISSVICVFTFLVLRKYLPVAIVLLLCFLSLCSYYWPHPHPWYIHSAHFWGILGYLALLMMMPFRSDKAAFMTACFAGLMAFLSLMTKSDVGAANGLSFFIIFLFSAKRTRALSGYVAGNFAAVIICAVFFSLIGYFNDAVQGYGVGASRQMIRLLFIPVWFKNFYWLPAITLPFIFNCLNKEDKYLIWIFYGIFFSAIFSLNVGSLRGISHIPMMSTYLAAAFVLIYRAKDNCTGKAGRVLWIGLLGILLCVTAIQINRTVRHSLLYTSRHDFQEGSYLQGTYELKRGAMKGWRFENEQGPVVDGVLEFIESNVPADDRLLILTDLQFINSFSGRDALKGVPFLWDIGEVPEPLKMRPELIRKIKADLPEWILVHKEENDQSPISQLVSYMELDQTILRNYSLAATWGKYGIFKKN